MKKWKQIDDPAARAQIEEMGFGVVSALIQHREHKVDLAFTFGMEDTFKLPEMLILGAEGPVAARVIAKCVKEVVERVGAQRKNGEKESLPAVIWNGGVGVKLVLLENALLIGAGVPVFCEEVEEEIGREQRFVLLLPQDDAGRFPDESPDFESDDAGFDALLKDLGVSAKRVLH